MKLIFLYGLPGTGKFTVAKELEKLTGYKLFHNHLTVDLVGSVFKFGSKPFIELREKIWLDIFDRTCKENMEGLIFTFAFEKTVPADFTSKVYDVVIKNRSEIFFIELVCRREELGRRIESPSRRNFGKISSKEKLDALIKDGSIFEPDLSGRYPLVFKIDVTEKSPAYAGNLIKNIICQNSWCSSREIVT